MSLAHAVLTSLLEKASSGYDLAQRFDKSIGYFWHATHQQIYRELGRMEAAGWIASSVHPDAGKTRKKEYRVLAAGRDELARWTQTTAQPMDLRDEFTLKLRAVVAVVGGPPVLRACHQLKEVLSQRLEIERLEGLGVVERAAHRVGERRVLMEHGEIQLIRPPIAV